MERRGGGFHTPLLLGRRQHRGFLHILLGRESFGQLSGGFDARGDGRHDIPTRGVRRSGFGSGCAALGDAAGGGGRVVKVEDDFPFSTNPILPSRAHSGGRPVRLLLLQVYPAVRGGTR